MAKHYPEVSLGMLFLGRSSSGGESGSFEVEEGGEATSPAP